MRVVILLPATADKSVMSLCLTSFSSSKRALLRLLRKSLKDLDSIILGESAGIWNSAKAIWGFPFGLSQLSSKAFQTSTPTKGNTWPSLKPSFLRFSILGIGNNRPGSYWSGYWVDCPRGMVALTCFAYLLLRFIWDTGHNVACRGDRGGWLAMPRLIIKEKVGLKLS